MEYRRILCTFLHHSPAHIITASTRQVLSALLTHCYNPEGLSRSLVATITQELSVLNEEHGYGLSIEEVQNYWFSITLDYQPTHPSSSQTAYDPSSINNDTTGILPFNVALPSSPPTHTETRDEPPFRNPRPVAHHPNQKVDLLLANAYNIVVFTWMTDFLLYPLKKRADLLVPRRRFHPPPPRPADSNGRHNPTNGSQPSKQIHRLPRRSPPPTKSRPRVVPMQVDGDDAGLAGCKVINNVTVESDPIYEHYQKEAVSHSESAYAQWDGAENAVEGEESFGEALELRMGYYREKLKRDLIQRDGPLCAASKQSSERLFCTQIIPESADTHRFFRFRRMASVFFAGQYDHLLEPPQSQSHTSSHSPEMTGIDHYFGPSPSLENRRVKRRGHFPPTENILRSSRNSINLSERWMKWLDEGRFTIRERGGEFYVVCLDPTLYHDPSFSRPGRHPNDPWESGHGLRLEIGATNARNTPLRAAQNLVTLPPISSLTSATLDENRSSPLPSSLASASSDHQLPTPILTPTSPPPTLSPMEPDTSLNTAVSCGTRSPSVATHTNVKSWMYPATDLQVHGVRMGGVHETTVRGGRRLAPPKTIASRLMKAAARTHPYAPKNSSRSSPTASKWQSHSELQNIRTPNPPLRLIDTGIPSQPDSTPSLTSVLSSPKPSSTHTSAALSRRSIASLLNPTKVIPIRSTHPPLATASSSAILCDAQQPKSEFSIPKCRKELWDVDALDPNLTRLHEQILTTWWATGLAPEVTSQMKWVDQMPLHEMNIVVLGENEFTSILKHKLTLL